MRHEMHFRARTLLTSGNKLVSKPWHFTIWVTKSVQFLTFLLDMKTKNNAGPQWSFQVYHWVYRYIITISGNSFHDVIRPPLPLRKFFRTFRSIMKLDQKKTQPSQKKRGGLKFESDFSYSRVSKNLQLLTSDLKKNHDTSNPEN